MGAFEIILVLLVLFFIVEAFKHSFGKRIIKLGITVFVIVIILLVAGNYFDLGKFFSPESPFTKTGASVVVDLRDNLDDINIDFPTEVLEDLGGKGFDYINKANITSQITRKIYK
ncbi:MAG: hypothetical protein ABIF40_02770 [archaeon]